MKPMDAYRFSQSTQASRVAAVMAALILVGLAAAPWWAGRGDMRLMSELFLYLSLATLWNLLAGYAGLVSVGQQAFVGFGGYALFGLASNGDAQPSSDSNVHREGRAYLISVGRATTFQSLTASVTASRRLFG